MSADPHPMIAELHRALVREGVEATMHLDIVRAVLGGTVYEFSPPPRGDGFYVFAAGVLVAREPSVSYAVAAALRTEVAALAKQLG